MRLTMREQNNEKQGISAIVVAEICAIFLLACAIVTTAITSLARTDAPPSPQSIISAPQITDVDLEAKAAYAYDFTTNDVLYSKNENDVLPLASLTKVMTAVTALRTMNPGQSVRISAPDVGLTGSAGLVQGEIWKLADILRYALIASSNGAASAVGNAYVGTSKSSFVDEMNAIAFALGFSTLHFNNDTGLDVNDSVSGGYGSAKEMLKLFDYAVSKYPDTLKATSLESESYFTGDGTHTANNTNTALSDIPNPIASKTGYTLLAGGNLALEFDPGNGHRVGVIVLGSSQDGRFDDAKKLVFGIFSLFSTKSVPNLQ